MAVARAGRLSEATLGSDQAKLLPVKNFKVLEDAGLVTTEKVGRSREVRLGIDRLDDAMEWITFYQRLRERRLDSLEAYFTLKKGAEKGQTQQTPSSC